MIMIMIWSKYNIPSDCWGVISQVSLLEFHWFINVHMKRAKLMREVDKSISGIIIFPTPSCPFLYNIKSSSFVVNLLSLLSGLLIWITFLGISSLNILCLCLPPWCEVWSVCHDCVLTRDQHAPLSQLHGNWQLAQLSRCRLTGWAALGQLTTTYTGIELLII